METESSEVRYLTDSPTTEKDQLNFKNFRPALRDILTGTETPLTVGVFGAWGSGKTSLLRMLKSDLDKRSSTTIRTVWFTAWKYDRHEALWRAFILRVLDALYPREPPLEKSETWEECPRVKRPNAKQRELISLLQRLEESVYRSVDWEELGHIDWRKLMPQAGKAVAALAAAVLPWGELIRTTAKALGAGVDPDLQAIRGEVFHHHRDRLASMEQFEKTFEEALGKVLVRGNARLVVFVDDLDRCLPEKAVEVLEAIKLFLEAPGTVFILGMDSEVIERGIEVRYGTLLRSESKERGELPISGNAYLQKIIQIPFYLPPLSVKDISTYIKNLDPSLKEVTGKVFAHGVFPNPRQVKRALNIFNLLKKIALNLEKQPTFRIKKFQFAWPLLAKTVLIQTQWPKLYRQWRQWTTLVRTLEKEYEQGRGRARGQDTATPSSESSRQDSAHVEREILDEYHEEREYFLLKRMLTYPTPDEAKKATKAKKAEEAEEAARRRSRFENLEAEEIEIYLHLAGTVEPDEKVVPKGAQDLLADVRSGDRARIQDAVNRLDKQELDDSDGWLREEVRAILCKTMEDESLHPKKRTIAGKSLAQAGDPRFDPELWFLPAEPYLGFVEIREGHFLHGSDREKDPAARPNEPEQRREELPTFYMARYPVTVAQFQAFIDSTESAERSSKKAGQWGKYLNHPVVQVNWHDADAYCKWLQERIGEIAAQQLETSEDALEQTFWEHLGQGQFVISLPSEAEWEKAARGCEGNIYPWGDEFDPGQANTSETGLWQTTAVGCFKHGRSPYHCEEMSGNVWEWSREGQATRGGCCYENKEFARCTARRENKRAERAGNIGFRVAVVAIMNPPPFSFDREQSSRRIEKCTEL